MPPKTRLAILAAALAAALAGTAALALLVAPRPPASPPRIELGPIFDPGRPVYARQGGVICATPAELAIQDRGTASSQCVVLALPVLVAVEPPPQGAPWIYRVHWRTGSGAIGQGWTSYASLAN